MSGVLGSLVMFCNLDHDYEYGVYKPYKIECYRCGFTFYTVHYGERDFCWSCAWRGWVVDTGSRYYAVGHQQGRALTGVCPYCKDSHRGGNEGRRQTETAT
jgi:hypothetical protein